MYARQDAIELEDGILRGPVRAPVNASQGQAASIHNDKTAQALGFRGGTVAGSIHMTQFVPLMLRLYGPRWFERGGLSLYFRFATVDREEVRAFARERTEDAEVWMDRVSDGTRVADGTAWGAERPEKSALALQLEKFSGGGEVRILKALSAGREGERRVETVTREIQDDFLGGATERLDWYAEGSPWGGAVVPPTMLVRLLWRAYMGLPQADEAVGLFGAIEIEHLKGPVFVGREYEAKARVLAVGETPKSEYMWFESALVEPGREEKIARMLMMLRFIKQSSRLWSAA